MPPGPDPEHSAADILQFFVESPDPAFVASEIADRLGSSTQGARNRLDRLVEEGYLGKKEPGARTTLYWLTARGHSHYASVASASGENDSES